MQKRWNILQASEEKTTSLRDSLKINPVLCKILVQRGIDDFDKAKRYFRPQLTDLHSPWLMKDMDKAVERILSAFEKGEKILVFGDYDVDGTTSVASMYQFIHGIYSDTDFYIPHRYREGYGVSKMGIDFAKENGFTLIISLDCGIKSVDLIRYARTLGIDFIVCDHHLPDKELPPAVAILNAKQADCPYPYKELCGCGVGFKLMTALAEKLGLPDESYLAYLDLVATAIAADIVPITGENRALAYFGLQKVNENPCSGIKALMQLAGVQKQMHITNLVFVIAPRVNAAGRMDDARKAVQLFIEKDYNKALAFAEMLHSDNADRKEADSSITQEALELIRQDPHADSRKTTVVFQEHWHKGVVGIVASRLIETYYRPTIVLTLSGDYVAGSARSVAGFNLYEAIHACREHLLGYGGHFAAAGMTLLPEKVASFAEAFEEEVNKLITDDLLIPEIIIDAEIGFADITPSFFSILSQMEPFGPDNMRPVFIARKVTDTGFSKIVKEQHIRFVLKQNNISFTGIGFNMADKFPLLQQQQPIDIVFTIDENVWNGETSLQLKMIDLRVSV
ncbi:MAG: single-stranded-DNA-specific exonuclease RecJ [Chitinophagaceae bacterium]|nr:single-stranded-DNA-specific exonuclease RecJ [Chitinophagaceae bacterium]MCA6451887.1 single-stranded-DNA-specific exonuclease RecJ [Chitinophagaceae bacterium]MCA6456170.1 single-stranded-DNA-specific exonuclease RecJ [Chitinophagaceae bacterium]MCA6458032.1 single-stranded-DNA-specific exonuclease RecJ [Chitinophagaceae bacterium]MCA6463745.1 single-stranded-DNA-specific exonuclease RecJ [Chitinophagaceae bacterium]